MALARAFKEYTSTAPGGAMSSAKSLKPPVTATTRPTASTERPINLVADENEAAETNEQAAVRIINSSY